MPKPCSQVSCFAHVRIRRGGKLASHVRKADQQYTSLRSKMHSRVLSVQSNCLCHITWSPQKCVRKHSSASCSCLFTIMSKSITKLDDTTLKTLTLISAELLARIKSKGPLSLMSPEDRTKVLDVGVSKLDHRPLSAYILPNYSTVLSTH